MCTFQCHDYNCPVREICETYGLESLGIDTETLVCQGEPYGMQAEGQETAEEINFNT